MSVAVYEEEIKFLKIKQEDVDLFSGGRTKFFPSFFFACLLTEGEYGTCCCFFFLLGSRGSVGWGPVSSSAHPVESIFTINLDISSFPKNFFFFLPLQSFVFCLSLSSFGFSKQKKKRDICLYLSEWTSPSKTSRCPDSFMDRKDRDQQSSELFPINLAAQLLILI